MEINIDDDFIVKIVRAALREELASWESRDPDRYELKYIKAMERVLKWYGQV
jgi:hypothetical protein